MKSRQIKYFFILVISCFFLVGCNQPTENQGDGSQQTDGPITLQWWGVFWDQDVVQPLIDEYQQLNPNVTINYANKWQGGSRNIAAKLYQDELDRVLRENNPVEIPDIMMVENTWAGNYFAHSSSAPASVIDIDTYSTVFHKAPRKDFIGNEQIYGIPIWMDSLAVIYNKDLLSEVGVSEPPKNWVDFKNLAIQLTKRDGNKFLQGGFAAGNMTNVSFGFELANLLMIQNGVVIQDSVGNPAFSTDADTEVALDFFESFQGSNGSWEESESNDSVAFLEGRLAMMVAPSWRLNDMLQFNDQYDLGIDMGVSSMPQLSGQSEPILNWATYWGAMVPVTRPNTQASWQFINWLTQSEQLTKLRQSELESRKYFGFLYPRTDMQQFLQTDEYLRVYNSSLDTAETWQMIDGLAVKAVFAELFEKGVSQSRIAEAENDILTIIIGKGQL